jgi:hypothetical protein
LETRAKKLACGGFGCRMHAMLRHFMDAARRRFVMSAIEMVERAGAFPNGKTFFNGLHYVSFG